MRQHEICSINIAPGSTFSIPAQNFVQGLSRLFVSSAASAELSLLVLSGPCGLLVNLKTASSNRVCSDTSVSVIGVLPCDARLDTSRTTEFKHLTALL